MVQGNICQNHPFANPRPFLVWGLGVFLGMEARTPLANHFGNQVARLQNEVCTKDFIRATKFLTKKSSENFPEFFEPLFCESEKNPAKSPTKFPSQIPKKITDQLLQERRENNSHGFFQNKLCRLRMCLKVSNKVHTEAGEMEQHLQGWLGSQCAISRRLRLQWPSHVHYNIDTLFGRGEKAPHPHTFNFTKKTARFTKGRFRPHEGPLAASLQDPSLSVSPQNCSSEGHFGSFARTKSALSKTGRFLCKAERVGVGAFSLRIF